MGSSLQLSVEARCGSKLTGRRLWAPWPPLFSLPALARPGSPVSIAEHSPARRPAEQRSAEGTAARTTPAARAARVFLALPQEIQIQRDPAARAAAAAFPALNAVQRTVGEPGPQPAAAHGAAGAGSAAASGAGDAGRKRPFRRKRRRRRNGFRAHAGRRPPQQHRDGDRGSDWLHAFTLHLGSSGGTRAAAPRGANRGTLP